jgi:hypothetical protein
MNAEKKASSDDLPLSSEPALTGDTEEFLAGLFGIGGPQDSDDMESSGDYQFDINMEVEHGNPEPRRSLMARIASSFASLFGSRR